MTRFTRKEGSRFAIRERKNFRNIENSAGFEPGQRRNIKVQFNFEDGRVTIASQFLFSNNNNNNNNNISKDRNNNEFATREARIILLSRANRPKRDFFSVGWKDGKKCWEKEKSTKEYSRNTLVAYYKNMRTRRKWDEIPILISFSRIASSCINVFSSSLYYSFPTFFSFFFFFLFYSRSTDWFQILDGRTKDGFTVFPGESGITVKRMELRTEIKREERKEERK